MKMTNYSQIMCLFIMLFFLQTQTVFAKDQSTKEKNEDLVLLLKVFTYSGNLKQAEQLVYKALKLNPNSIFWHKKMSEVKQWRGDALGAADHLTYVAINSHNTQAARKALTLYRNSYQYEKAAGVSFFMVKEDPSPKNVSTFMDSYDKAGKPVRAADYLFLLYKQGKIKDNAILTLVLSTYIKAGKLYSSKKVIRAIAQKKITDLNTMQLVSQYYLIKNKPKDAYKALRNVTSYNDATRQQIITYNMLLSDLAWNEQAISPSIEASNYVIKSGQGRPVDFERTMKLYQSQDNSKQLLFYAKKGFETQPTQYTFYTYAYLALEQKKYQDLLNMMTAIKKQNNKSEYKAIFNKNALFWMIKARVFVALHRPIDAKKAFKKAVLFDDNLLLLSENKLWLLIDMHDGPALVAELSEVETKLEKGLHGSPELWMAMAVAYNNIHHIDKSAYYLQKVFDSHAGIEGKLALKIMLLQQMGKNRQTDKIQYAHFMSLQKQFESNIDKQNDPKFLTIYLPLLIRYENPDKVARELKSAEKHLDKTIYTDLLLEVALKNNDADAFRYYSQFAKNKNKNKKEINNYKQKAWINFYVAFAKDDYSNQQQQLYKQFMTLSATDSIESAVHLKQIAFAQELAFSGLAKNQHNVTHYEQHRQLTMRFANNISNETYYLRGSGLGQAANYFKSDFYYMRGFSINSELFTASNSVYDDTRLVNIPNNTVKVGVGFDKLLDKGNIQMMLGTKKSMETTVYLKGAWHHSINDRLNTTTSFAYGDDATETVYLYLGGQKDYINLEGAYALTNTAQVQMNIEGSNFRSQDNIELGKGTSLLFKYSKKLIWGYPDIVFSPYVTGSLYSKTEGERGVIDNLLPDSNIEVISDNYWNAGIILESGVQNKNQYTHVWRPFITFSPFYNSVTSGLDYAISFGGAGMLFGDDHLAVELNYSTANGGFKDETTKISLQYMKYF